MVKDLFITSSPFAKGLLGVAVGLLIWHLWVDHVTFHQLLDAIATNQRAAQAQAQGQPAVSTPAPAAGAAKPPAAK